MKKITLGMKLYHGVCRYPLNELGDFGSLQFIRKTFVLTVGSRCHIAPKELK